MVDWKWLTKRYLDVVNEMSATKATKNIFLKYRSNLTLKKWQKITAKTFPNHLPNPSPVLILPSSSVPLLPPQSNLPSIPYIQ